MLITYQKSTLHFKLVCIYRETTLQNVFFFLREQSYWAIKTMQMACILSTKNQNKTNKNNEKRTWVNTKVQVRNVYRYSCCQQTGCCYLDHLCRSLDHPYPDYNRRYCNDHRHRVHSHYFVVRPCRPHRHGCNCSCYHRGCAAAVAAAAEVVADLVHAWIRHF